MKILAAVTIVALAFFLLFPKADLIFSGFFYDAQEGFPYRKHIISEVIYRSVRVLTYAVSILGLFIFFYDKAPKNKVLDELRAKLKFTTKQANYLLLVIIITPGILVHWIMKPLWDRARPVNITEFGGNKSYTDFYHIFAGQDGNSFPSGHASMATALIALGFIVAPQRRKMVFIVTSAYAFLASMCRIWQGGHFLSDVTFSVILTLWTILIVKRLYLEKN